ncbi:MAG: FAD-dependent oxidoreductase, partial [Myxococcota bacterium]
MGLRETNLNKMSEREFDVLIIGGGINGAVSAAALAARGVTTALIDRGDWGGGTSQESSNLVWGGIKYMENYELSLVWELCESRNRLMEAYPANIREIRFFTAVRPDFRWHPLFMYAGTWAYWFFGRGYTRSPRYLSKARIASEFPMIDLERFAGGVEYSDAYLVDNDSRFVFSFVRSALNFGAIAANYVEMLESKRRPDGGWETTVRCTESGKETVVRSRVVVNAAGPYADEVVERAKTQTEHRHVFAKGIHLLVDQVTPAEKVLTFFDETGRMFFVIPMGPRSVIGTTDTRVDRPETQVTAEDREFLFRNINACLKLDRPLGDEQVISERCGVRPLVVKGNNFRDDDGQWFNLSRKHVLESGDGIISMYGGKLTDCLNIGEEVVELVGAMGVEIAEEKRQWFGEPPEEARHEFFRQ